MDEFTKCPECGNEQIIKVLEEIHRKEVSVKTGKVLKNEGFQGMNCWNYRCRCGWYSGLYTE